MSSKCCVNRTILYEALLDLEATLVDVILGSTAFDDSMRRCLGCELVNNGLS